MINGFIIIDKPPGITSHDVVSRVRRITGTRRVGHTGTLDPFATGVLPIAINDGTKAIPFLDEGIKCYEALMQLGTATDTLDITGQVLSERDCTAVNREMLLDTFTKFTGTINQIPPMFSAIKQNGQPLYKLARQGQQVERAARQIVIHSIELLSFESPLVSFRVSCSRGSYIRTLADDIGSMLGCGACLKELRRTASGPFLMQNAVSLDLLENASREGNLEDYCVTPYAALGHLADITLNRDGVARVCRGRSPEGSGIESEIPLPGLTRALVRLSSDHELVAVAEYLGDADAAHPAIVLKRVFKQPDPA